MLTEANKINENLAAPHIPFIQKSALGLINSMETRRERPTAKGYTDFETNLMVSLSEALYTGRLNSASEAKGLIPKIKDGDLEDHDIIRFIKDLDYLYIYETKGIGGLNQRLLYLFSELKKDSSRESLMNNGNELIDLIYRAIYLFPHEIRSIAVDIKPDYDQKKEEFKYMEGRETYPKLRAEYESNTGQALPQELILPLPFFYSTGTHGSGERNAMGRSYGDIILSPLFNKDKESIAIALNLEEPFMTMPMTDFTIDEINSITFSTNDKFTPWVKHGLGKTGLSERRHYLDHYLAFRDFAKKISMDLPKMSDDERGAIRNLLSPNFDSELWEYEFGLLNINKLIRGFFVEFASDIDDISLFEVSNKTLKSLFPEEATLSIFLSMLRHKRKLEKNMKMYKGASIINRLTSIPISSQFEETTPFAYGQYNLALLHLLDPALDASRKQQVSSPSNNNGKLVPAFNS